MKEGYPLHPDHVRHSDRLRALLHRRPGPHVPADDVPHPPAEPGLPGTVTLCPRTSRISHILLIFGEYFGNPLVSCTDDHAYQRRLMLGIEDTLLGMSVHSAAHAARAGCGPQLVAPPEMVYGVIAGQRLGVVRRPPCRFPLQRVERNAALSGVKHFITAEPIKFGIQSRPQSGLHSVLGGEGY